MSIPHLFIDFGQVGSKIITIDDADDVRHLQGSLRARPGDITYISDNRNNRYTTVIKSIDRKKAIFEVLGRKAIKKIIPQITLFQCILKKNAMKFAIQKTTEMGVSGIIPVTSKRTVSNISGKGEKIQKWQKISDEASKQSKRDFKCCIEKSIGLEEIDTGRFAYFFFPYEEAENGLEGMTCYLKDLSNVRSAAYLIGPEGGLTPEEAGLLKQKGALEVNLGKNILRAETASIYFFSVMDLYIKLSGRPLKRSENNQTG